MAAHIGEDAERTPVENFRQLIEELKRETQSRVSEIQQQAEAAELLDEYQERQIKRRRDDLTMHRSALLTHVLESLNCEEVLIALRESGLAQDFEGPIIVREPAERTVRMVLSRQQRGLLRSSEQQIGVRVQDAGSVLIQVVAFYRSGRTWEVDLLSNAMVFTPEERQNIEDTIIYALYAWAQGAENEDEN